MLISYAPRRGGTLDSTCMNIQFVFIIYPELLTQVRTVSELDPNKVPSLGNLDGIIY